MFLLYILNSCDVTLWLRKNQSRLSTICLLKLSVFFSIPRYAMTMSLMCVKYVNIYEITKLASLTNCGKFWPSCFTEAGRVYSENARVCAKWQWIARPAKPGVQSSNTSRVRFRFYHIHIVHARNCDGSDMSNVFNAKNLLVVTYFSNAQFVPFLCWVLVKHAI